MPTLTIRFQADTYAGGSPVQIGDLNVPINVTLPAEMKQDSSVTVPTSSNTIIFRVSVAGGGGTEDIGDCFFIVVTSPVDGVLSWQGDVDEADNGSISISANVPFIIAGNCNTTANNATFLSRGSGTLKAIHKMAFYQTSGSDAVVRVVTFK